MTKKIYNQPEVATTPIVLDSIILAGSPCVSSGADKVNPIETDDQW
ncbi:MAG: hypothetical protein IJ920_07220 [Paludibacteraceae bacterium]|nr:hypothetical protein [Paludibacteraceae bacterium]MBR6118233.1 hypothetical protein [Paludibacteraceae bacterium]